VRIIDHSFDAKTRKVLTDVLLNVWREVKSFPEIKSRDALAAQADIAMILLRCAHDGERDPAWLKHVALRALAPKPDANIASTTTDLHQPAAKN
jgi:hypothetical protein